MARKSIKRREQDKKARQSMMKDMELKIAGRIKDRYPNVKSITLDMNYSDPDGFAMPHKRSIVMNNEDYAYFKFDCPYRECVNGGHDLNSVVSEMLKNNQEEIAGSLSCQGWQDEERINQHRCLCLLQYKIIIEYIK